MSPLSLSIHQCIQFQTSTDYTSASPELLLMIGLKFRTIQHWNELCSIYRQIQMVIKDGKQENHPKISKMEGRTSVYSWENLGQRRIFRPPGRAVGPFLAADSSLVITDFFSGILSGRDGRDGDEKDWVNLALFFLMVKSHMFA
jgi:hypothetical protein